MKIYNKKWLLSLVLSAAGFASGMAQQTVDASVGTLNLTLDKAIEIALAENPTIRMADKDIELKKVAQKEAWQALLPKLDASLALNNSIKVAEMKLSFSPEPVKMGIDNSVTGIGGLTLSLPIYAPTVYQNMKLTKQDILLAQEAARGSRLDLVNQVTKAYYGALLSADSYEVVKKSFATAKENFDVVNGKFQVGKVSEYDKISAEVQMRNTNSSLVSAGTGKTLALLRLKVLMGVTANVDIVIDDSLKAYESSLTLPEATTDISNNSGIRQLDQNIGLLQRTRKILHTNFQPVIGLQLQGQYQSNNNDHWNVFKYKYSPSVSLALSLSVPVFHADNWTKLKTNKIKIAQLNDKMADTRNQLVMAAESYRQNMASSIAQVESNREAVKQANKGVSISSKRYEVGRGTILELNQSEDALTLSELTYVQSIYDYLTNKADFEHTLGKEK